jgi:hypothetical protein
MAILYKKYPITISTFKVKRFCNFIFHIYDLQGDGEVELIFSLFYKSIKFKYSFFGSKCKWRYIFQLFGENLQGTEDNLMKSLKKLWKN